MVSSRMIREKEFSLSDSGTVLVVDDDESTRSMIIDALQDSKISPVFEAENGIEALEIFQNHPCDLIISDIKMPGMSGIDLLNEIMKINPAIHMILITGFPTLDLSVSAIKTGAADFIAKPFNIDELLYKVNLYLREKKMLSDDLKRDRIDSLRLRDKISELSKKSYIYDRIESIREGNEQVFEDMVDLALKLVNGESCAILLYDAGNDRFEPKVVKSSIHELYSHVILPSLNSVFREAVRKKEPILMNTHGHTQMVNSLICVPLKIRNTAFGVMTLSRKRNGIEFTQKDLNFIQSLTRRASLNLENKILYESTYSSIMDTFYSLAASIQARDYYTEEHSIRVTDLAVRTAKVIGIPQHDIESLKIAGMLHDIGKISVPDQILLKKDGLSEDEFSVIKGHCATGEMILKPVLLFEQESRIIRSHHERWDGRGYPDGLAGCEIPLNARILTVVDSFDAMTNNRPYRRAMKTGEAVEELERNVDKQFDKIIVEAFLKIL
ncbi:MAG: response regulator [Syntrophales bacterium]|nr:response regulator [Syntrophales bacterium]MDD5231797.1 response regulator [Syntrophales bacterium]MDD5531221.1 response regulator [Syntrophales bacterium]